MGKVRVWGPLGSSAFRYEARPRGDVVDPPEASESILFDVRRVFCLLIIWEVWRERWLFQWLKFLSGLGIVIVGLVIAEP